jgi:hypothetical protein
MSSSNQIGINVVSESSLSPEEEAELRMSLESSAGASMLKALALAWKAEHGSLRMVIDLPGGRSVVSENLKFKELEYLKELVLGAIQFDDDRKLLIHLEDDQLTSNRVAELYVLLGYVGILVKGWESDSEFTWKQEGAGTSAFFWEGGGLVFPESDFN